MNMSTIRDNFVQDNETVKSNITYTEPHPINDDTSNYRTPGGLPITANYEVTSPYPIDARTLVPKESYLTNPEWWRTTLGIDTIIYKGMLVTCMENHMIYIYDGETIKITNGLPADRIDHWKKERIDKSLTKWPIDVTSNDIVRIGKDVVNPLNSTDGVYIAKNENLRGGSLYINDKFISIGMNKSVFTTDETSEELPVEEYPFIPYDIIPNEQAFTEFINAQTGIFIPTNPVSSNNKLSIYSATGIKIQNTQGQLYNTLELNGANTDLKSSGHFKEHLLGDKQIDAKNIILNSSTRLNLNTADELNIKAVNGNINIDRDFIINSSSNIINASTFGLYSLTDVSIKASHNVDIQYIDKLSLSSASTPDKKSKIILNPDYITFDTSTHMDFTLHSTGGNTSINLNAKNGTISLKSKDLVIDGSCNINAADYSVTGKRLGFNNKVNKTTATKYSLIDVSSGLVVLETYGVGGTANITLSSLNDSETGLGTDNAIISMAAKEMSLKSNTLATIDANNLDLRINGEERITLNTTDVILGKIDTSVYINAMVFPTATNDTEGVLKITKGRNLKWSRDIGCKHSDGRDLNGKYLLVATIQDFTEGTETLALAISDENNTEIYSIRITYSSGAYTGEVYRLSYFHNATHQHKFVIHNRGNNTVDIYMADVIGTKFSWNGLAYSNKCIISEAVDAQTVKDTLTSPINPSSFGNVIYTVDTVGLIKDDKIVLPAPNISDTAADKKKPNHIDKTKSGFLRYTRSSGNDGYLDWGNLDNQLKDVANNDAGTKVYIVGTEQPGLTTSTCNEFYNSPNVYIDQYLNIFATAFYATSDRNKKKDIKDIEVSDVSTLKLREFVYKNSGKKAYGFIAQEVEEAGYPEIVNTDEDGSKTLDYNSAFAITIAQMQKKIEELEAEIKILKNK